MCNLRLETLYNVHGWIWSIIRHFFFTVMLFCTSRLINTFLLGLSKSKTLALPSVLKNVSHSITQFIALDSIAWKMFEHSIKWTTYKSRSLLQRAASNWSRLLVQSTFGWIFKFRLQGALFNGTIPYTNLLVWYFDFPPKIASSLWMH